MNTADLATFNEAVKLAQLGKKQEAYSKLRPLAKDNLADANLFLWIAFTTPDLSEAERAINQAEKSTPDSPSLLQAKQWFAQEKTKHTPPPPVFTVNPIPHQNQQYFPTQQPYFYQTPVVYNTRPKKYGFTSYLVYFLACLAILIILGSSSVKLGTTTLGAMIVVVVASSIWAAVEADHRRNRYGPGAASNPLIVFLLCFFVWILAFPSFLNERRNSIDMFGP